MNQPDGTRKTSCRRRRCTSAGRQVGAGRHHAGRRRGRRGEDRRRRRAGGAQPGRGQAGRAGVGQVDETHTVGFTLEGAGRSRPKSMAPRPSTAGSSNTSTSSCRRRDRSQGDTGARVAGRAGSLHVPPRHAGPRPLASSPKSGDVLLEDDQGKVAARIPHGWMVDSSRDPKSGGGTPDPNTAGVTYELSGRAPRQTLHPAPRPQVAGRSGAGVPGPRRSRRCCN